MPALESLPRKIGPYRVLEKIGEGGMGVVYLARDMANRRVAVKVLGPAVASDPDARLRLAREVETMLRVRNRHVAEVLAADINGPAPYIVTRYVQGQTLEAAVRQSGPLRGAALTRLASGLAEALAAIHAAGVVHRDLKPGNVMLDDGQPVVIDFGIAHVADATRLTKTGLVMGTPGYVSPEVIEGHPSSGASDVHSWGATVAFAATGRQPFGTGDFQTVFFRVLEGRAELAGVPPELRPLVTAALATDPLSRPTARGLAETFAVGTRQDGTRFDGTRLDGTRLDGTRLDGTRVNGARVPAAWSPVSSAPWQPARTARPSPAEAAADVADLLPPVNYARPGGPAHAAPAGRAIAASRPSPSPGPVTGPQTTGHGLISLAFGIAAVALSVLLPVAGAAVALVVITLLRAADRADRHLAERRRVRGTRPSDILIVIVTAPWTVARAVITTVLLALLALPVAAVAAAASVVFAHSGTLPEAGSWAAGAAVAFYCVGPGSRGPRRQLRRMSATVIRSRGAMIAACISTMALALAVLSSAVSQPPLIWPATSSTLPHLLPSINMLPSLGDALHSVQGWLLRNTVGMLHLP